MEEVKLSLFADGIIVNVEKPRNLEKKQKRTKQKTLTELINELARTQNIRCTYKNQSRWACEREGSGESGKEQRLRWVWDWDVFVCLL